MLGGRRIASRLLRFGTTVGLLLAIGNLPAKAQQFSAPTNLSNSTSRGSLQPRIAVDASGNINVIWVEIWFESSGFSGAVIFARSTDGGTTFSAPKNISPGATSSTQNPQLAQDSTGKIYVLWQDSLPGPDFQIFFTLSTDGGESFPAPQSISAGVGSSQNPQIAVASDGTIHIVWEAGADSFRGLSDVFYTRSTDGGASFSTPMTISAPTGGNSPQLAVDAGNNVYVVWSSFLSGEIYFSRSTDGGGSFSSPQNLSNTPDFSQNARLAVNGNGRVYVVWEDLFPQEILFSRSTDSGASFSAPKNISANAGFSLGPPQIALDANGNINVVWMDTVPPSDLLEIFFSRSADGGDSFSSPTNVSAPHLVSINPQLVVASDGNINVAWGGFISPGNVDILFNRSTDGGLSFSGPQNISNNTGTSIQPQMAADAGGTVYLVWSDDTPGFPNFADIFFTRTLLSPAEAIQRLIADVNALNLRTGISNSLDAKLDAALQALNDVNQHNNVAATNALQAFINAVEAQRGKSIMNADADRLTAAAQAIITQLSRP